MDEQRFDSLTRSLAMGRSRRTMLRGLLCGVGVALFARSAQTVEADSPRALRAPRTPRAPWALRDPGRCGANQAPNCAGTCCPGDYVCFQDIGCHAADQAPCGGGSCPPGFICSSQGMCLPPGGSECGAGYCEGDSVCVNGQGCLPPGGTVCGSGYCAGGQVCLNGQCERACDGGATRCGSACVDVASNPSNCGACGVTCAPGQVCGGGVCSCPVGTELCGGACVDVLTDLDHCGACDAPCQAAACMDAICVEGHCERAPIADCCTEDADCNDGNSCTINLCDPGTNTCGSVMVDEGEPCPADDNPCTEDICDGAGQCIHPPIEAERRVVCLRPDGLQGICVDGDCVVGGPGPDTCDTSTCSETCCGEECVNLQLDPLNCGACGTACATDESCIGGTCVDEDECDLTDWRRFPEWVGTFTRVLTYDSYNQNPWTERLDMRAEVHFQLTESGSPMFYLTSYAGTCSVEYTYTEEHVHSPSDNVQTTAAGTVDITGRSNWALFVGGNVYGENIYQFRLEDCTVPAETIWLGQTWEEERSFRIVSTRGEDYSLPGCPGPITGEWETVADDSFGIERVKETWSIRPAG